MNEFEMIKKFFAKSLHRTDVIQGIGDDAAIVTIPKNNQLVITTDTLVQGVHFTKSASPEDIGYKSLAVNLSDLAAMGATPAWVTLSLTLPKRDEKWLRAFCKGFFALAKSFHVELIGGDLTHGPLAINVQAMGFVPKGKALLRSTAKPSDRIYVSGALGDAGLALLQLQHKISLSSSAKHLAFKRLNRPTPRVKLGQHLLEFAHAAIDISDGLASDLGHILDESKMGAEINVDALPLSNSLRKRLSKTKAIELALTAGDDYELCFTVPIHRCKRLEKKLSSLAIPCTCIGVIKKNRQFKLRYQDGTTYEGRILGYQHF